MKRIQIEPGEIDEFYLKYINLTQEDQELLPLLKKNQSEILNFFESIPDEKWNYKYGPDKWNILEVLQHLIDTERIFQYRALSFARNDINTLPGYDHNAYVPVSNATSRSSKDLINEFKLVRDAGIALFQSFDTTMLTRLGSMNGNPASARAIGFIIAGHALHHRNILIDRYL